jgi:hypothetical protein
LEPPVRERTLIRARQKDLPNLPSAGNPQQDRLPMDAIENRRDSVDDSDGSQRFITIISIDVVVFVNDLSCMKPPNGSTSSSTI